MLVFFEYKDNIIHIEEAAATVFLDYAQLLMSFFPA